MSRPSFVASVVLAIAGALAGSPVHAQQFPARPLRLVVPFAPGGSTDVLARIVGQRLAENVNQPVVIDNRTGAGGTIGSDLVAKAPPDGHTLLIGSIATMAIAKAMYSKLPYEPLRDFAHINLWVTFPLALVVPAASPFGTTQDLIAAARAKPASLRFAAQGIGTSSHAFVELMNTMARLKIIVVPYKGGAPALNGVLAGEVDYALIAVSTALAQVGAGKIRALGVTSAKSVASLPNVPPIAAALPGYEALNFHGLHAPAKTPPATVARLHAETARVLQRADVVKQLNGLA
ncbi:MAG: tripartite tricarboxylate transporter substrate binding protein, partial [Betaproteobacteria bacterium]